jgi:hypothetical protein
MCQPSKLETRVRLLVRAHFGALVTYADWIAVANLTGMGKMHGSHNQAPTIPEMADGLWTAIDAQLAASDHADLAGSGIESIVASLIARAWRG